MDEPTSLLPPVSTVALSELLEQQGPLPLARGLELMGVIAGQVAKLHANARTHGLLTTAVIRVQTFESGPPLVIFQESEATRDMAQGADQWALGVLTFQVLAGRLPKVGEAVSSAVPAAPAALDKLVSRLMAANPAERLNAAGAQRQFLDLAAAAADPMARPASVLAAPPHIKRGVPIGAQKTDAHAWVQREDGSKPVSARASKPLAPQSEPNPFGDDEATAMVANPRPTAPDPPPVDGPAMDDEPTQFEPVKRPPSRKSGRATERAGPVMAPPVPTPQAGPAVTPVEALKVDEPTREQFEPSRSDLPGNTGESMLDPRLNVRKKKKPDTPMEQLMQTLGRQPPWVWGAAGVGLAFFVLLLIALAR